MLMYGVDKETLELVVEDEKATFDDLMEFTKDCCYDSF